MLIKLNRYYYVGISATDKFIGTSLGLEHRTSNLPVFDLELNLTVPVRLNSLLNYLLKGVFHMFGGSGSEFH